MDRDSHYETFYYFLERFITTECTEDTEKNATISVLSVLSVVDLLCHDPFTILDQNKLKSHAIRGGNIV